MSVRLVLGTVALAVLMAVGGCASTPGSAPSPSVNSAVQQEIDCQKAVANLVAAVRDRVDTYDTASSGASASASVPTPSFSNPSATIPVPLSSDSPASGSPTTPSSNGTAQLDPLLAAVTVARDLLTQQKCLQSTFSDELKTGLGNIHPAGAIAKAVLARISATLLGHGGQNGETKAVWPTQDLTQAVAEVGAGATIELQAGTYRLNESLVLLDGVTIRGVGKGKTILRSTAPDAAIVVATSSRVEFDGLSLMLDSTVPASGILTGPNSQLVLTGVRISGARSAKGQGGAGVQMSASSDQKALTTTTLQVTGSQFDHNAWAGIALSGGHRVSIESTSFVKNGQCGICFLDASSGSVDKGTFTDNAVGVGVNGTAKPVVVSSTITGGSVGVQVDGSAAPILKDITISGADRAAAIFSGTSTGALAQVTCKNDKYDIAIGSKAAPSIGKTNCKLVAGK